VPAQGDDPARARRGLRPLLASAGVSVSGDGAFNVAAPLLAVTLTNNPAAIATVTAAVYAPWLFVGLPAGALVDRWPKRLVLVWSDLLRVGVLGLFCALMVLGHASLVALVITVILVGIGQCFFDPAAQTVVPFLVGRDEDTLNQSNGRLAAVDAVGRAMIGPLGGAWIFTIGRVLPFVADAVSFLISALFVSRLPRMNPHGQRHEPILTAVRTGLGQLYRVRELFVLALATATYNIGYFAVIATFVLYSRDILHVDGLGYGAYFGVLATSAIVTGWKGTRLVRGMPAIQVQALAMAVAGIGWLLLTFVANIWVTGVLFASIGVTAMLGSVTSTSACQRLAPDGSLGRINSIFRCMLLAPMESAHSSAAGPPTITGSPHLSSSGRRSSSPPPPSSGSFEADVRRQSGLRTANCAGHLVARVATVIPTTDKRDPAAMRRRASNGWRRLRWSSCVRRRRPPGCPRPR
jgi:MFS family permease